MNYTDTPLSDAIEVKSERIKDHRGHLARLFCSEALRPVFGERTVVQINHTLTKKSGAIRGLHYQVAPSLEAKLVRCLKGCVWDVAVDLRENSPTFLHWHSIELNEERMNAFFIPEGFAHGFQTLSKNCELLYLHTAAYAPDQERGLRWDDPQLAIDWPLPVAEISQRDLKHPPMDADFKGIRL